MEADGIESGEQQTIEIMKVEATETETENAEYLVVTEEDLTEAEGQIYAIEEQNNAKSIEINIEIIKTIFMNFLSLYEALLMKNCHSCDMIRSEEFVRVHNNFVDIDGLFKVFDLSFDKTVLENFVKKSVAKTPGSTSKGDKKEKIEHSCLIPACTKQYSSFESVQVHFLKSHCCPIPCFEPNFDSSVENEKIDFTAVHQDSDGYYICQFDEYCHYSTKDRSNFRVHRERHRMAKRFHCFVCNKYFTAKEPLIIHFIRGHFATVSWTLAATDIRLLRKAIRKCTTPMLIDVELDQVPDIEEDLTGPESLQNLEISAYISQAINNGTVTRGDTCTTVAEVSEPEIETTEEEESAGKCESQPEEQTQKKRRRSNIVNQIVRESEMIVEEILAKGEEILAKGEEKEFVEPVIKKLKTRAKNFRCIHDFCSQDFYGKKQLLIHLKSNHDEENRFICEHDGCFSRFKSQTLLAQHERRHKCQLQCEHCEYRTHLPAQMEKHIRQHTGAEQPHVCPECSKRFTFLGQMSTHRKLEHKIVESLACDSPNCGKIFKTIPGLQKHKREFHLNIRQTITCEWPNCDSTFSNNSTYQKHLRIHNNERPILCEHPGCDKSFRLKETMVRHLRTHESVVTPDEEAEIDYEYLESSEVEETHT